MRASVLKNLSCSISCYTAWRRLALCERGQVVLTDHSRQAARQAQDARRHRQALQNLGDFIYDLDFWDWSVTISFRYSTTPHRAFAAVEAWLTEVEGAAGGRIGWAIALSRGELGGRVHLHILVAGVDDLDMKMWEHNANGLFGDCQIAEFDAERGGADYFAKNALAEHGDYRLGGNSLENRETAAEEDDGQIHARSGRSELKTSANDSKFRADHAIRPAIRKRAAVYVRTRKRAAVYVRISAGTRPDKFVLHERTRRVRFNSSFGSVAGDFSGYTVMWPALKLGSDGSSSTL